MSLPDAPPSRLQRWVALHATALQIGNTGFAIAASIFVIIVVSANGWGPLAVALVLGAVGLILQALARAPRSTAHFVAGYDQKHGPAAGV